MKKALALVLMGAAALFASPAAAQLTRSAEVINNGATYVLTLPNGQKLTLPLSVIIDPTGTPIGPGNPLPIADGPLAAATSTPIAGTAAAGTTIVGPFTPQLGRAIRVTLRGTWVGTFAVGTSTDNCASISPLTIGGSTWGSFTGNANEVVDIPTLAGVVYCGTATVSSGSLNYGVRN